MLTCLVTLFDRKLQVFKNSPKWTIFGIFVDILSTQNVNITRFARCRIDIQVFGRKCHDIGRKLNEVEKVQKSPNIHWINVHTTLLMFGKVEELELIPRKLKWPCFLWLPWHSSSFWKDQTQKWEKKKRFMTTNWRAVSHVISKILWTPPLFDTYLSRPFSKRLTISTNHHLAKQNNTVSKWTNICLP